MDDSATSLPSSGSKHYSPTCPPGNDLNQQGHLFPAEPDVPTEGDLPPETHLPDGTGLPVETDFSFMDPNQDVSSHSSSDCSELNLS